MHASLHTKPVSVFLFFYTLIPYHLKLLHDSGSYDTMATPLAMHAPLLSPFKPLTPPSYALDV
jgi:hypothetical protein